MIYGYVLRKRNGKIASEDVPFHFIVLAEGNAPEVGYHRFLLIQVSSLIWRLLYVIALFVVVYAITSMPDLAALVNELSKVLLIFGIVVFSLLPWIKPVKLYVTYLRKWLHCRE